LAIHCKLIHIASELIHIASAKLLLTSCLNMQLVVEIGSYVSLLKKRTVLATLFYLIFSKSGINFF